MINMNCTIPADATIRCAMKVIDEFGEGVVLVMDNDTNFLGIVTDGDVRRGLLKGASMDDQIGPWISKDYISVGYNTGRAEVLDLMQAHLMRHVPVVDDDGKLLGLHLLHNIIGAQQRDNWAVIMAGGKGTRLYPITKDLPKPMVKIAGRPILERLILHLVSFGIRRIFISVNYMGHIIQDYFGDGKRFACSIEYLEENEPLGTGGGLALLPEKPTTPVIVMNGDLVLQANLDQMLSCHIQGGFFATIGAYKYSHQIPYGCIEVNGDRLRSLREKPISSFLVNAGIYVLSPEAITSIPKEYFPITTLFELAIENNQPCGSYLIQEEWADVGQIEDLRKARGYA